MYRYIMFPQNPLPKCASSYLIASDWYDWELQITGKYTDSIEEPCTRARVYASTRLSIRQARYALRHRKRGVNAQPPAARQRPVRGPPITPPPTIAAHAGNSDVPATATCRRHLLCGNPSTWPKQSYGVCSNIKVDNVHNPTYQRDSKDANMHARVVCDRAVTDRPCIFEMQIQSVSARTNTFPCDDRRYSSNWRKALRRWVLSERWERLSNP